MCSVPAWCPLSTCLPNIFVSVQIWADEGNSETDYDFAISCNVLSKMQAK
jgi:hypothetical protein